MSQNVEDVWIFTLLRWMLRIVFLIVLGAFFSCNYKESLNHYLIMDMSKRGLCKISDLQDSEGRVYRVDVGWVQCKLTETMTIAPIKKEERKKSNGLFTHK